MDEAIKRIFIAENTHTHINSGITIARVTNSNEGLQLARNILLRIVDSNTLLLLSGGRTPKQLYTSLADEKTFYPGAVGMVDERYGKRNHPDSNEKMLGDAGFLPSLVNRSIRFYPILQEGMTREETAVRYDEDLRSLFTIYQKSIAILGIGLDGHTAGIPASSVVWKEGFGKRSEHQIVSAYDDHGVFYHERVTMTFLGLSLMDLLLVLVFGEDKKEALEKVFDKGAKEEIPGRFYKDQEIAKKTIFITDQNI